MRIHHLALRSDDLSALERFYVGVLGLTVTRRDEGGRTLWLDAGGAIVMLEKRAAGEPAVVPGSMELTCFEIAAEEHGRIASALSAANVAVEGRTAYTLYVRDPEGRRVGLSSYPVPLGI